MVTFFAETVTHPRTSKPETTAPAVLIVRSPLRTVNATPGWTPVFDAFGQPVDGADVGLGDGLGLGEGEDDAVGDGDGDWVGVSVGELDGELDDDVAARWSQPGGVDRPSCPPQSRGPAVKTTST
jgi:hypothetical protein